MKTLNAAILRLFVGWLLLGYIFVIVFLIGESKSIEAMYALIMLRTIGKIFYHE